MIREMPPHGEGFYWIRIAGRADGIFPRERDWQVAEWSLGGWWVCGSDIEMNNEDFPGTEVIEIGPKIERPA